MKKVVLALFGFVFFLLLVYVWAHGGSDGFCFPDWEHTTSFMMESYGWATALRVRGEITALVDEVNRNIQSATVVFGNNAFDQVTDMFSFFAAFAIFITRLFNLLASFFSQVGTAILIAFKSVQVIFLYVSIPFELFGWVLDGSRLFQCPVNP